ncbi:DUF6233 domain-containing protein [Streptomyces sp. NBC_01166]|uniref:DUF6233 domain-containing protein n=1 Tax=Streptomyces sp. NBC_01166 TaxID=2903755 RepID=UPI00386A830D
MPTGEGNRTGPAERRVRDWRPGSIGAAGAGAGAGGDVVEDPAATLLRSGTAAPWRLRPVPDQVGLMSREDAMVALDEPDIEPCQVCRPDTGLTRG